MVIWSNLRKDFLLKQILFHWVLGRVLSQALILLQLVIVWGVYLELMLFHLDFMLVLSFWQIMVFFLPVDKQALMLILLVRDLGLVESQYFNELPYQGASTLNSQNGFMRSWIILLVLSVVV